MSTPIQEVKPRIPLPWLIAIAVGLLCLPLVLGVRVWDNYRETLMENQKSQLLLVAQTMATNLEISLSKYEDTLDFLAGLEDEGTDPSPYYEKILATADDYYCDLYWEDADGNPLRNTMGLSLGQGLLYTKTESGHSYWMYTDEEGSPYLVIKKELAGAGSLCLVIDEAQYYNALVKKVRVGTNGYIVVKTSDQVIVLHPSRVQWGIGGVEGRRELYPDLDYSSLEQMVETQYSTESGVLEYYSYWWMDPEFPRAKKVAAHAHVHLSDDAFWIVSAVVDYTDLYNPIASSFRTMLMILGVIFLILALLCFYIGWLLWHRWHDISEIEYLRRLNGTLEDIHRSEQSLAHQQRLQAMGVMAGGVAHEFNNFLTPIMGYADLLTAELPPESDAADNAREIYDTAQKASDLVRQISSMSRKNVETVYRRIEAKPFLEKVLKVLHAMRPDGIDITLQNDLTDEQFLGSRTQLQQVLLNLCTNAIQAIGEKGGHICLTSRAVSREVTADYLPGEEIPESWKRYIQIDVRDDGCGIDANTLRHIFEPFYTTKKAGEGTGLGLSLADGIIRSHHGFLSAESTVGAGSVFHIFLPVLENGSTVPLAVQHTETHRFLMVDDNPKILRILTERLGKLGLEVQTCDSREAALAILRKTPQDVLAADENLRNESGIDLCMALEGQCPGMLRIVMADRVTRELVEAKQRGLIDGYLEKPISPDTLLEVVENCWTEKHL